MVASRMVASEATVVARDIKQLCWLLTRASTHDEAVHSAVHYRMTRPQAGNVTFAAVLEVDALVNVESTVRHLLKPPKHLRSVRQHPSAAAPHRVVDHSALSHDVRCLHEVLPCRPVISAKAANVAWEIDQSEVGTGDHVRAPMPLLVEIRPR